ncbi:rhamnulokinase [Enorma phocaeensis]|uniref:rhamnulokinase n=1 Tax=Enorma phocaeensis TaxID=1871019 RepID=UPI00195F082D|nr:rhamnulokinase family protein [Enorma phocaeensis]MBM6953217.1 rhamnulokinase [Enorma phocaeensis]
MSVNENTGAIHVAAVDLGASGGRVIVGTYREGQPLALDVIYRFDNGPADAPGPLRWDIDRLVREVRRGLDLAAERYELTSVGIDTWGVDYGMLDAEGELLEAPVHYRDARTQGMADELAQQGGLYDLFAATGTQMMDINTAFQLKAALRDDPELEGRVDSILLMPGLIAYLLGADRGCEPSEASTTQLVDAASGTWSDAVCDQFGIPVRWLPKIASEGAHAGSVELSDGAHVPFVRVCGHDTASAVASISLAGTDAFVSCGTWSLVGVQPASPVLGADACDLGVSNERGAEGSVLLLQNCTGLWIAQELRRELNAAGADLSWDAIVDLAEAAPAEGALIDTESPEFGVPGSMSERIRAFAEAHGEQPPAGAGELFRCVYESLAARYHLAIEELARATDRRIERVRIIGGGSQNRVICQLVADTCGIEVIAGPVEATAIGNIFVQLKAAGVGESLAEVQGRVELAEQMHVYTPAAAPSRERLAWYRSAICHKEAAC